MKISATGTFSVKRSVFENQLKAAGYEIISLSGKTELLLVGEKTVSTSKIQKARELGVRILEETDAEKIIGVIAGGNNDRKKITLVSTHQCDYYTYGEIDGEALKNALLETEEGDGDEEKVFESFGLIRLDDCEDSPEEPSQRIII